MIGVALVLLSGIFLVCLWKDRRRHKRWAQADQIRNDLFNKYLELCDDPFMNDAKWKEWIPVFEYADKLYEANDCLGIKPVRLADRARQWVTPTD